MQYYKSLILKAFYNKLFKHILAYRKIILILINLIIIKELIYNKKLLYFINNSP